MPRPTDARTGKRFRIAAAALAAAPVGFAAGALLGARHPALLAAGDAAGGMILASGLGGAAVAATLLALATTRLAPKPARVATLVAGAGSFAILVYLVGDFVNDRIERGRAFDIAYARLPAFAITLEARDPQRRPFSMLAYDASTRRYTAHRPGGWICTGIGNRRQKMAVYEGLRAAESTNGEAPSGDCAVLRASWTIAGGIVTGRCNGTDALFAAADEMIEATARGASCRRGTAPQGR